MSCHVSLLQPKKPTLEFLFSNSLCCVQFPPISPKRNPTTTPLEQRDEKWRDEHKNYLALLSFLRFSTLWFGHWLATHTVGADDAVSGWHYWRRRHFIRSGQYSSRMMMVGWLFIPGDLSPLIENVLNYFTNHLFLIIQLIILLGILFPKRLSFLSRIQWSRKLRNWFYYYYSTTLLLEIGNSQNTSHFGALYY